MNGDGLSCPMRKLWFKKVHVVYQIYYCNELFFSKRVNVLVSQDDKIICDTM